MKKYQHGDVTQWQKGRFGMFIHWGVYSMYAKNEWCKYHEKISDEEYQILIDNFNPDLFNPSAWAKIAKNAGMKHVIFTTKHHDGFCMWDSNFTDYKITNTSFGRNILKEIVDAFRTEGLKIGLYYSISDWHHPDFIIDGSHALHYLSEDEKEKLNEGRDMSRYAKYMRDQVKELLTEFGGIIEFWFDVSGKISPEECESEKMLNLIRSLQPNIILNDRLALQGASDIVTPENYLRESDCVDEKGNSIPWEGCHTLTAAWGYNRDEKSYDKTPFRCLEILITQTSMNGNSLMNIGPTSRGAISDLETERLNYYAHWMRFNSRSIYDCGAAPDDFPPPPRDCRYTYNKELNRLYIHIMRWPDQSNLVLHGLEGKIKYAQLLHDGSRMEIVKTATYTNQNLNPRIPQGAAALRLMSAPANMPIPVIECIF